jgi:hypothetical protein
MVSRSKASGANNCEDECVLPAEGRFLLFVLHIAASRLYVIRWFGGKGGVSTWQRIVKRP